jgi:Fe-Mn family superoxide dismutase
VKEITSRKIHQTPMHSYRDRVKPVIKNTAGITKGTMLMYHDQLYVGYVKKANEIENRLDSLAEEIVQNNTTRGNATYSELRALKENETYAVNGIYLHEWYFELVGATGNRQEAPDLSSALAAQYGSLEAFIKFFSQCAMAARGWTVLAWDTHENRLRIFNCDSHNQGSVWGALPIIVLDVYEHAYMMDFGADRESYIRVFWETFNWSTANELYKKVSTVRL